MPDLRTRLLDLHLDLTPGSLIPSRCRTIAERVLLMQFFQKHLSQAVESVVSARKEPEGASAANAGKAAEHVVIDVVARPSQHKRIVVVIIDSNGIDENLSAFQDVFNLRRIDVALGI